MMKEKYPDDAATDRFTTLEADIELRLVYTAVSDTETLQAPFCSYSIAWSIRTGTAYPSSSQHSKIKISPSQVTRYTDYAPSLPDDLLIPEPVKQVACQMKATAPFIF